MGNKINLGVGFIINDYIILGIEEYIHSGNRMILREKVKCICGKEIFVRRDHLLAGRSKNCGCKKIKRFRELGLKNKTHGMDGTKFYNVFQGAKYRCNNKNNKAFHHYGGRGIKFEWKSFEEFKNDMYKSYLLHIEKFGYKNTSLDRIDVNGNYCKENCRWATWKIQQNNKRSNRLLEYRGEIKTLSQLEELGFGKRIVNDRINLGWDIERAINEPPRKRITKSVC